MSDRLFLAVTAWHFGPAGLAGELAAQAGVAESLGYHSFWLPENHFGGDRSIPSPLMLLAAVAATTERIRLGSTSYLLPIRHPLHAAEEVAVLDRLSGGRVILGVGRGVQDAMFQAFAIDQKDKRKRFKTNLDLMIRAWHGEPILDGNDEVLLAPLPVQSPHPPIWVAAFGPLAIKQAGTLGLPYLASPVETLQQLAINYERHRQFGAAAGHPPVETVPVMRTLYTSEDRRDIAAVRRSLESGAVPAMRDAGATTDEWTIVGDRHYVADKLAEYREVLGMTHLIVRGRIAGMDNSAWVKSLERLAAVAG